MGKKLFLSSVNSWCYLPSIFCCFCNKPHKLQQWIMGWFQRDMWCLICSAFSQAQMYATRISHWYISVCVFDGVQSALSCACVAELMHVFMCPFACMHILVFALRWIWSYFFYVVKAILRVTFQKPWRAGLLSVCARLCDSVWVEKAQGHISGPLPIMELHSLQMILWWGESGGIVDEKKWPRRGNSQRNKHMCAIYINTLMLGTVILWQAKGFPL